MDEDALALEVRKTASQVRVGFQLADENGDGVISRQELKVVLKQLGIDWGDDEFEHFFDEADKSRDGMLQYDEFVDFIFGLGDDEDVDMYEACFPETTLQQACTEFKHLVGHPNIERRNVRIRLVAEAVALIIQPKLGLRRKLSWHAVRRLMVNANFASAVIGFNAKISSRVWSRLEDEYLSHPEWQTREIRRASKASGILALWVEHQVMKPDDSETESQVGTESTNDEESESSSQEDDPKQLKRAPIIPQRQSGLNIGNSGWRSLLRKEFPFQGYIEHTEHRGITFNQLRKVQGFIARQCHKWVDPLACQRNATVKQLAPAQTNLYHANEWLIKPATQDDDCAFVELFTKEAQKPTWFCSHWWGEPVFTFLRCVERHAEIRELDYSKDAYWVCAYANRQHSLDTELTENPKASSFYKALQLSRGVLLILDPKRQDSGPATPFSRIWCNFEEATAVDSDRDLLMDIVTCSHKSLQTATILTDGVTKADESRAQQQGTLATRQKMLREQAFPIDIVEAGLKVSLQAGAASNELDKIHILNCISEQPLHRNPPLDDHPNYDRVNAKLRAVFAAAAWRSAVHKGKVDHFCLPEVISANRWLTSLILDLSDLPEIQDTGHVGRMLVGLEELANFTLNLSLCANLRCLKALGRGLGSNTRCMKCLTVHFRHCVAITSARPFFEGVRRLPSLERLDVNFSFSSGLIEHGIDALAGHEFLKTVKLDFEMCESLTGTKQFYYGLTSLPVLESFYLSFVGCMNLPWSLQRLFSSVEALAEACKSERKSVIGIMNREQDGSIDLDSRA